MTLSDFREFSNEVVASNMSDLQDWLLARLAPLIESGVIVRPEDLALIVELAMSSYKSGIADMGDHALEIQKFNERMKTT